MRTNHKLTCVRGPRVSHVHVIVTCARYELIIAQLPPSKYSASLASYIVYPFPPLPFIMLSFISLAYKRERGGMGLAGQTTSVHAVAVVPDPPPNSLRHIKYFQFEIICFYTYHVVYSVPASLLPSTNTATRLSVKIIFIHFHSIASLTQNNVK